MNPNSEKYTLITGASRGLGKAFALRCAQEGHNLILVALPGNELEVLAQKIQHEYGVKVQHYPVDLNEYNAPVELYQWCMKNNLSVNVLINNAGISLPGRFKNSVTPSNLSVIQINVMATVVLTRLFLDDIQKHHPAHILNVGSFASFIPLPYKCVYSGSKAFVYSFTRGLREELKNTHLKVSVLCPGPMPTNGDVTKRIKDAGFLGKIMSLSAQEVAEIGFQGMLKGKPVIIPGFCSKFYMALTKAFPDKITEIVLEKIYRKEA